VIARRLLLPEAWMYQEPVGVLQQDSAPGDQRRRPNHPAVLVGAPSLLPPPIPRWAREGNQGQAAAAWLDGGDLYDEQLKRQADDQQCLRCYYTGRAGNEGRGLVPVVQWLVDSGNRVRCINALSSQTKTLQLRLRTRG
jgi:hypothetical protein